MAGTGSTSSSLTSTSHTLTHAPGMAPSSSNHIASAMSAFLASIEPTNRHVFLQPPSSIPSGSLELAKETLDAFAAQVSDEQQLRQREAGKKRKRDARGHTIDVLKIRKLHIDGFETGQIWQQAKRIISSALAQSQEALEELEDSNDIEKVYPGSGNGRSLEDREKSQESASDEENMDSLSRSDEEESLGEDDVSVDGLGSDAEDVESEEAEEGTRGEQDDLLDGEEDFDSEDHEDEEIEELIKDPNGLNDGFFSIDLFNKQSQWFEDQDARGDPNTDQVSDEEDLDWHADPMKAPAFGTNRSRKSKEVDDLDSELEMEEEQEGFEEDEDDDMPAFGNMDLDAPDGASDEEGGLLDGTGDDGLDEVYYYKDFFAPPAGSRKARKKKQALPEITLTDGSDMRRAMNDVRRDLFEDLSEHSDSEDALSEVSAGDPRSRRSAHERRQAKIAEEIRKLESELVAKRAWTLSGEAAAVDRPLNSLLEEDLDFEHAGKPLPVITEEVSESIEALIKRRILAQEFDEVLRRRPDTLGDPSGARRGLLEIDSTRSRQGLGDELAEEHVKNANPETYLSKSDEKHRREEQEIQNMWKDVCGKLDALSSWHYKPKPVEPTLTVVSDVATVSMEDAQPTTAQGVSGGHSMIAPQEIYKAGQNTAEQGEIVSKSGLPVARQEMSREEKLRRRRREKERLRKAGGFDAKKGLSKKAQTEKETVSDLKKGRVMVINRKGEITNVDGKKAVQKAAVSSSSVKL